jgi:cell division protein FtsW (lipid II flippase)
MGVTYTTAVERDARHLREARRQWSTLDLSLIAASLLAVIMMAASYLGRSRLTSSVELPARLPVNLNTVADAGALEPAMQLVFASAGDRQLAARELFGFLVLQNGGRRALPNVGSISRARMRAEDIERANGAVAYRRRLADERARAADAKRPGPESLPLFSATEIAAIKPALVVRDRRAVRFALLLWGTLYLGAFHLVSLFWKFRGIRSDPLLLAIAHLLTAVGFAAMISRPDPLRDLPLFVRYAQGVIGGLALTALASSIKPRLTLLRELSYVPLAGVLVLSALLIVFGTGPAGSNARVNLGSVQPIEAIRLLLCLFLAGYFAKRWELIRAVRGDSVGLPGASSLDVPRARYVVPVLAGVGAALALFVFQRDLGPALMLAVVFLAAYGIARGRAGMALLGVLLLAAGIYIGYRLQISTTLADRVRMWESPWDNTGRGGDQVAHALWAFSTGGLFGTGLGLGDSRYLPAGHTDLVLAAIAEELGAAGLIAIAALYAALIWRALSTARRASTDYSFFLALVIALFVAAPVLLMMCGVLGLLPLTGVVTPFLSYGGSAMLANFASLGLLAAIRSDPSPPADLTPFRAPVAWLSAVIGVGAIGLIAVAMRVQVVRADEIVVRPHLGVQADGTRRYQYNPRVLDVARQVPRGPILDRNGLPLATSDPQLLQRAASTYERAGVSLKAVCADPGVRCYPFGGRLYHLLGDARWRTNWSAGNTSFVERDSEAKLRGFDDHQTAIPLVDSSGRQRWTLRRDYRELVPLLRHRYRPNHPAATAFRARSREIRLTIDGRLQNRVAGILDHYAELSPTRRAAAVVIDPDTGDLLASVSYPWPTEDTLAGVDESPEDELLDRARYGLYPPGSTFKILTAAAALRRDPASSRMTFSCSRLPDGRVGAKIAGWSRPVRDDVLDKHPHGTINMRRAIAVSCNAYFAQLAMWLGPETLQHAADRAELSIAEANALPRIRDTLPQIGYGQGEVVASPLRMARLAAAIADDGVIRDVRLDAAAPLPASRQLLSADSARLLASFMRDVVVEGTGRALRSRPTPIAGKTGTAEIANAPSHAWFVGFAPYGSAARRIALAVIIENAGYGGAAAAPVAGDIIAAAAALGLIR